MTDAPAPDQIDEDDDAWERRLLKELAEGGAEICRYMQGRLIRAVMAGDDAAVAGLASAHARQARSVRMCIAQRRKLKQLREDEARREQALKDAAQRDGTDANALADLAARAEVDRLLVNFRLWNLHGKDKLREVAARAIETEGREVERERLLADLDRRLAADDAIELAGMPIGEAIGQVCAELGLDPDWSLWTHQAWAIEAGLPGVAAPGPRAQAPP